MNPEITTRVIRTIAEIEEIRSTWESWQIHPNTDIDLFITNIQSQRQIVRPHIIVTYRHNKPECMLTGRIINGHLDLKVGYASFLSPRVRTLAFAYAGFLGNDSRENCAVILSKIMESLKNDEADVAVLKGVKPDSPLFDAALHVPGALVRDHFPAIQVHRSMKMHESFEDLWKILSGDERRNQKRRAKKLLQECSNDVRIECYSRPSDLDRIFRDVEQVAKKTYQRGLGVGFGDTTNLRQIFRIWAEKDCLRVFILYVTGKPCAFWIGTLYGATFHSDYMGYDPGFNKFSPGTYLVMRAIEVFHSDARAPRVGEIDFGLGDAQWKEMLGNQSWEESSISIFSPTVKGVILNALRSPVILFDRYARKLLGRTQFLPRIKKAWRDHVVQT